MEETKNELVVANCAYPVLAKNDTTNMTIEQELMADEINELGGVQLKLPKIKLGASGNGKLEVPDNDNPDESRSVKELEGVIICALASRAKWKEGETIPECSSRNGRESLDGKICANCQLCKFKRQADGTIIRPECKESRNLYLLTKEHSMPLQFQIPPSGIKAYDDFARTILSSKKTQLGTIVKISVEVKENNAKQKYNCAKFESVGRVENNLLGEILSVKKQITNMINSMSVEEEYSETTELEPVEDQSLPF
jgi:hypothetical protein